MPFTPKDWKDAAGHDGGGDTSTPLTAAALEDMEDRLSDYTDSAITALLVASGSFSPVLTNTTNLDGSTTNVAHYLRIGTFVVVGGRLNIDPTATGNIVLGVTFPIASAIGATFDVAGTWQADAAQEGGRILGNTTDDRATFQGPAVSTAAHDIGYTYTYKLV
jgi:hypothetical protein